MITIFTPTYNRAHLLQRLYNSLSKQTILNTQSVCLFEWVVVDDGSTDKTEELMLKIKSEACIPVNYIKKTNGGKHTAINRGVKEAKGDLFWILDSDDSLPTNAIELLVSYISIMKNNSAVGICGYMAHHNGDIIGKPVVAKPQIVSLIDMRYKLGISGDMMEVFRTSVLREFPFPEIDGERFCPEVLVWYRIARKYKLLLVPEIIYYRDYLDGGLTDNIVKIRMNSPIGSMMTYSELFICNLPFRHKLRSAINYWRFAFCSKNISVKIKSWGKLIAPLGLIMHLNDKRKINL